MAKSKSRRRKPKKSVATKGPARKPGLLGKISPVRAVIGAVLAGLAVWGIAGYLGAGRDAAAFEELVAQGRAALGKVERMPNDGRGHVRDGAILGYRADPPTSGRHSRKWVDPGVYRRRQTPERLVHSIEHGMVVIYYETPDEAAMETLETWAGLFGGMWSGVVLVPKAGLGSEIVLTAWRRRLRMPTFDAAGAASFIDAYRGRGPENRVR